MASVTYEHVYKRYPGNTVITDMNAEIKDKEFVVLVGPSGSGKSTALRMLAGLEEITDGSLRIGDRVVNDVAPKDRDIAMVFQSYALYPHMSVRDNMSFGLKLKKVPKPEIERRVAEGAGMLGLEKLLDRKPRELPDPETLRLGRRWPRPRGRLPARAPGSRRHLRRGRHPGQRRRRGVPRGRGAAARDGPGPHRRRRRGGQLRVPGQARRRARAE